MILILLARSRHGSFRRSRSFGRVHVYVHTACLPRRRRNKNKTKKKSELGRHSEGLWKVRCLWRYCFYLTARRNDVTRRIHRGPGETPVRSPDLEVKGAPEANDSKNIGWTHAIASNTKKITKNTSRLRRKTDQQNERVDNRLKSN